jgi:hypothetical protein
MDRNPHVHTYADRRVRISVPRGRARLARTLRACLAEEAAAWRRGKPGRMAVAADTFGAVATWHPRWRERLAHERHTSPADSWRDHRRRRLSAAIAAINDRHRRRVAAYQAHAHQAAA